MFLAWYSPPRVVSCIKDGPFAIEGGTSFYNIQTVGFGLLIVTAKNKNIPKRYKLVWPDQRFKIALPINEDLILIFLALWGHHKLKLTTSTKVTHFNLPECHIHNKFAERLISLPVPKYQAFSQTDLSGFAIKLTQRFSSNFSLDLPNLKIARLNIKLPTFKLKQNSFD